jgi:hypothetical protein
MINNGNRASLGCTSAGYSSVMSVLQVADVDWGGAGCRGDQLVRGCMARADWGRWKKRLCASQVEAARGGPGISSMRCPLADMGLAHISGPDSKRVVVVELAAITTT